MADPPNYQIPNEIRNYFSVNTVVETPVEL